MPIFLKVFVLIFILINFSCTEDVDIRQSKVKLELGFQSGNNQNYIQPFSNQEKIYLRQIKDLKELAFLVSESDFKSPELETQMNGGVFNDIQHTISISTKNDHEVFVKGINGRFLGGGFGIESSGGYCSFSFQCIYPIKITDQYKIGNDTLEIDPISDRIMIIYESYYINKKTELTIPLETF